MPPHNCCLWFSVSASFDGKQHLRSLPVVNSVGYVLRFLAKLCRSLLCDDLFSHQPFPRGSSACEGAQENQEGRMESGKLRMPSPCLRASQGLLLGELLQVLGVSCGRPRAASREALGVVGASQEQLYPDGPHPGCSGQRSLHYSF